MKSIEILKRFLTRFVEASKALIFRFGEPKGHQNNIAAKALVGGAVYQIFLSLAFCWLNNMSKSESFWGTFLFLHPRADFIS